MQTTSHETLAARTGGRISRRRVLVGAGGVGLTVAWLPLLSGCGEDDDGRLVFLNWQDYVDRQILDDFDRRRDVVTVYDTYASNDELAKRLGAAGVTRRRGREATTFDLIVPSDNLFRQLKDGDALLELGSIDGVDNLRKEFRSASYDPGNRYAVPWATGTTGIGYSLTAFPDAPPDWTTFLTAVDGGATLLDETRDAMAVGHFLNGTDPNSTDTGEIEKAGDTLARVRSEGVEFDAADYLDRLQSGDIVMAQAFSSDMGQAIEDNDDLAFVVPQSGGLRWVDLLCIPAEAPHPDVAKAFVEYYLEPEVSATNSVAIRSDTGNEAAAEFVPAELLADSTAFPSDEVLDGLAAIEALDEDVEKLYSTAFDAAKK